MRGMNMRQMKARQMGKAERTAPKQVSGDLPPALDEEPGDEEPLEASALVDQGDGVRVRRGRRRGIDDDERSYECPDEPPPGWGGDG